MGVRRIGIAALLLAATASRAAGQTNAECAGFLFAQARNMCDAGVDGAHLFTPVAGLLLSGGNPFLGGSPMLGFTARLNVTQMVIPDVNYDGNGRTVAAQQRTPIPVPLLEGSGRVFRGISGGHLAVDLLGSAQLIPTQLIDNAHIGVNASHIGGIVFGFGIGGRLRLIGESRSLPGVAVSVMRRTLPRIGVGSVLAGDNVAFASNFVAVGYRATIGKRFGHLVLGGGAGWTKFSGDADISFRDPVSGTPQALEPIHLDDTRAMGFVDAGLALGKLYLIGEAGMQRGKDLQLGTTFTGNNPTANRFFGSIGLRVSY